MNHTVSILTSVIIEVSARESLRVRTLMEATYADVILVSEVIFVKTLMSATKPVLVIQMHHV